MMKNNTTFGILKSSDGGIYQGFYLKNSQVFHGFGKITYPDKETYEGNWINGMKHGSGELILANKCRFKGYFKNDNYFFGEYIDIRGTKYIGPFKDNMPHGYGTGVNEFGVKHIGYWKNGLPFDKFSLIFKNGNIGVAFFSEGVPSGTGYLFQKRKNLILKGLWDGYVFEPRYKKTRSIINEKFDA